MKKCPLIQNPSKNQKSSKVNMKSTICHDFPSPDLLEGPKDRKIKENAKVQFFHSKVFKQGKQPFLLKMHNENNGLCREKNEKLCKVQRDGESNCMPFIDRTEYYNLS